MTTPRMRRALCIAAVPLLAALIVPYALSQAPDAPVAWAELAGTSVSGGALSKAAGSSDWNAGAVSTKALSTGDGYVELTAGATDSRRAIGLSRGNTDASLADIDFALELDAGTLRIHEAGEARGAFGTYVAADKLRVAVELGAVVYRRNGAVLHRSVVPPQYPLLVDTSFHTVGGSLTGVVLSGALETVAVSAPVFSIPGGTYAETQTVILTVDPPSAAIYYTLNGAEPTETDAAVASGGAVVVDRSLTLKARAWAPGLLPSRVSMATYLLGGDAATPTPTAEPGSSGGFAASMMTASSEPPHPILSPPTDASGADAILAIPEAQYIEMYVPKQAPRHWDYGFGPAVIAGDTGWSWSASTPNQITSTPSATVFSLDPAVHKGPAILYEAVPVLSGKTVMIPYHLAAGSTTRKSLPYAHIDYSKRAKLRTDMLKLAAAYIQSGTSPATRNNAYARRIAVALDAWANYVPDYFISGKNSATFISAVGFTVSPSDLQRASDHNGYAHEWDDDELKAFDCIYDSLALEALSAERGYDVRNHIRAGYFENIGDFIAQRIPVSVAIATNLSGPFVNLARVARVLYRPDYMAWMKDYMDATVRRKIMRDGTLNEGIGYSYNYISDNLAGARETRDYFLTRPADTPLLQELQARSYEYVSLLQYGQAQWNSTRLPDGRHPSFGDTTFNTITARRTGVSGLIPAYGHVELGAGTGTDSVQLSQNFSDDGNHMRADVTAFALFANNDEQLGNVRYHNGTPGRQWGEQILEKNAVTIDRVNMSRGGWTVGNNNHRFTSGNLNLYEANLSGLHVTEVDGQRAYTNKAQRYQRVMVMNTTDLARPYVVDVFRVGGGTTHDYTFHGAIRFDQTWESSVPLTPDPATYPMLEPGEVWVEPTSSGSSFPYYGFWREVSKGPATGNFHVTYRDTNLTLRRDVRLWVTDGGAADLFIGKTPVADRVNGEPPNFYKYWRPSTILRRRISSGTQQSLFAHVVEPLRGGGSRIVSVERLPLSTPGMEAVALRITFTDGRRDTVLVNLNDPRVTGAGGGSPSISTADGAYVLDGRIAAHSAGPQGERAWSVAAADFRHAGGALKTPGQVMEGVVTGFLRQATGAAGDIFVTSTPLPEGTALQGKWLSLRFETYRVVNSSTIQNGISEMHRIDRVERVGGETHVYLDRDHQLVLGADGKLREQVACERTFEGPFTFQIALDQTAVPISPIADVYTPRNTPVQVSFTVGALGTTPPEGLSVTAASSNGAVVDSAALVLQGSGNSYTLAIPPQADVDGKTVITVSATGGAHATSRSFIVRVGDVNDPPTISPIGDQLVDVNGTTGAIPFTVADPDTPVENLVVTASSSNPAVSPVDNILIGGSGAGRTVTVTAAPEVSGASVVTISVSDGRNTTTETFTVAVNAAPTISEIENKTVGTNGTTGPIAFTIGDRETPAEALAVTASSSNTTVVPVSAIVLGGSGAERTVTVTPAANQVGTAIITLRVNDGVRLTSGTFAVTVDVAPQISLLYNRTIAEDSTTGPIAFSVSDKESPVGNLIVTGSAADPSIVPAENIQVTQTVSPWTSADLGAPQAAGSSLAGEIFSIKASGNDIWSTSDRGHYVSQPMTGDGEMVARVTSVEATDPWAKAGVMFRAGTAGNSAHAFMLLSASNGVAFQRRTSTGGSSSSTGVTGIKAPAWVRLVKAGSSFSAFYAVEDAAGVRGPWIQVGTPVTINSATWRRGLAATSHKDGTLSTSTYDNVSGPANVGGNRVVTVTPAPDANGTTAVSLSVNDGYNVAVRTFNLTVTPVNDAPTLGAIEDRTTAEDTAVAIALPIGDVDAGDTLTVTATSSNQAVMADSGFVVVGEGLEQTLHAVPVRDASGSARITVSVSDGLASATQAFTLNVTAVNDAPTISDIPDHAILVDSATVLHFTIGDVDHAVDGLVLTVSSSNTTLVPNADLTLGGSGAARTLTISPRKHREGTTTITITVSDGEHTVTETFVLTVNNAPWMTPVADKWIGVETTDSVTFTVHDADTVSSALVVTASSSNAAVIPADGIVVGGNGNLTHRTVTLSPVAAGSTVITLTVSDGLHETSETFTVTAN